jgi:MFS family permease
MTNGKRGFLNRYSLVSGNFLILVITWIFMNSASPIPQTYAPLYFKELGADNFLLGVITFCGLISLALVQFPGGYLADKHGRRWLVFSMTFGVALSSLFFVFAPSWHFIVLGTIIQSLCLIYQPALFAIMLDSVSPENRGAGFTLQSVITSLVGLPAAIAAGYLVLIFNLDMGERIAYVIMTIAYLAAAVMRVRLKETLSSDIVEGRPNLLDAVRLYPRSVKEGLQVWGRVPRAAFFLFLSVTGVSSLVTGCSTYFVVYATSVLGVAKFQWAIVLAFMSLTVAIPAVLSGLRMDRVGRKRYLVLAFLLYVPAMLIFVWASFYMLMIAFFFFGLGQTLQFSSYQSLLGDLVPREFRGKVVGCGQFFMYISQALTSLLVGALYSYVWAPLPFLLLAFFAIPMALLVSFKVFEPGVKEV